jgi:hypothetical protein
MWLKFKTKCCMHLDKTEMIKYNKFKKNKNIINLKGAFKVECCKLKILCLT